MNTALLVIDVQQALCAGAEAAFDIQPIIERINAVITQSRAAGVPVVFVQHEEGDGALQPGSDGWQLDARLSAQPGDARIRKTAPDAFAGTGLKALLDAGGIERLVVCGLQTDCCIDATVRQAVALGYSVELLTDAHSTVDSGGFSAADIIARHNAAWAGLGPRLTPTPSSKVSLAA
jgi:nicotinamidase-related amidase